MGARTRNDESGHERLLTIPEVAGRLAVGRTSVYQLINKREIPVVRIGTAVRVPASAVDAFIRGHIEPGF